MKKTQTKKSHATVPLNNSYYLYDQEFKYLQCVDVVAETVSLNVGIAIFQLIAL